MDDTHGNLQNSGNNLKKSLGREDDGSHFSATNHMSSVGNEQTDTLIEYDNDETLEIKEESIPAQERYQTLDHNFLPDKNRLDKKSTFFHNNSGGKTCTEYDNDKTLKIKEEVIQDHEVHHSMYHILLPDKNRPDEKSTFPAKNSGGRTLIEYDNGGTLEIKEEIIQDHEVHHSMYHILPDKNRPDEKPTFSDKNSGGRTLIEYVSDETLEIKEEIIQDEEIYQSWDHNLLYDKNHLEEKSVLCDNSAGCRTFIECDDDETLEIKEEMVQDRENTGQTSNKNYELKFYNVEISADDIFATKNLQCTSIKQKMQESKHNKKKKLKTSQTRHNCANCSRTYSAKRSLTKHERLEHAAVKPQFICDLCSYKTNRKDVLSSHITLRHFNKLTTSQARHKCDKCSRSYSLLNSLYQHNRLEHAAVKSQFICDICSFKTNIKHVLSRHISLVHFKMSKTSQAKHNCAKCSRSYTTKWDLIEHERLEHGAVKPQFICDVCGYKANMKHHLLKHISVGHFKNVTTSQARHKCDKCSRSYNWLSDLKRHARLKHPKE